MRGFFHTRGVFHFVLFLGLLSACGKDASIQLNKPERTTREVHVELSSPDERSLGDAKLTLNIQDSKQNLKLVAIGHRKIDVGVGENIEVKAELPEGWEVAEWKVSPGGNVDYSTDRTGITIGNVQNDLTIAVVARRIAMPKKETREVKLIVDSQDAAAVEARITCAEETVSLYGSGQRACVVPIGENAEVELSVPTGWEIDFWDVIGGGEADYSRTSPKVELRNLQENVVVKAKLRRIPPPSQVAKSQVKFILDAPEPVEVGVDLSCVADTISLAGSGQRVCEISEGTDVSVSLKLPSGWEMENWIIEGGGESDYVAAQPKAQVRKIAQDVTVKAKIRRVPFVDFLLQVKTPFYTSFSSGYIDWVATLPDGSVVDSKTTPTKGMCPDALSVGAREYAACGCKKIRFPNGTKIEMVVKFVGADDIYYKFQPAPIVLREDTHLKFNFYNGRKEENRGKKPELKDFQE